MDSLVVAFRVLIKQQQIVVDLKGNDIIQFELSQLIIPLEIFVLQLDLEHDVISVLSE
jgi:hypothetical protein